jgi:hypothetical protein
MPPAYPPSSSLHRPLVLLLALAVPTATARAAGETPSKPPAAPVVAAAKTAPSATAPAATVFDRLKGLAGDWIDASGAFGMQGKVAVTYRVTGGGSAVVETLFAGMPHEMVTVYHKDGSDLVLTHYCAGGNQPRMRARTTDGSTLAFEFDGGTNLDPAKDDHMHAGRLEFVSGDEIRAEWQGWSGGRPDPAHLARFHLTRRKG